MILRFLNDMFLRRAKLYFKSSCVRNHIGVLGFGRTGKAAVDFLLQRGVKVSLYDDNGINEDNYRQYYANLLDEEVIKSLSAIVISPGICSFWPKPHKVILLARKYGVELISDLDLFQKNTNGSVIAVTGTNGKSTTTALIHHILELSGKNSSIGGNFGPPILSLDVGCDFYVLELSSYQLEQSNILGFDTAILLNITPDHLTRHGGMCGYIAAKQKVFVEAKNSIIGIDDPHCREIFDFLRRIGLVNLIPISGKVLPDFGVGWQDDCLIDNRFEKNKLICKADPRLDGSHNRQNIAAAYAACVVNRVYENDFVHHLGTFKCLEHRQEFVACIDGVQYVNDSKATNADSVEQALMRFNNIFWILGGRPKEDGIFSLQKYFSKIKHAFLIGEAAKEWNKLLFSYGVKAEITVTLENAVKRAHEEAKKSKPEVVLLSPACASFDQFKSFEERGEKFKEFVGNLEK